MYLNELDQFVKHGLRCRYYMRYTDDFVLLDNSKEKLAGWMGEIRGFLESELKLNLNYRLIKLRPVSDGVDFVGYVVRRDYILVRRRVVNNMERKLKRFERHGFRDLDSERLEELRNSLQSYLGHFKWANSYRLREKLLKRKAVSDYFKIVGYRLVPRH